MSALLSYKTLRAENSAEFVINKSRFIGHGKPVETEEEALAFLAEMRETYKDATHNCYAYIIGLNSGIMRYSDDGEPGGTAGMPIIEVMKARGVVNCAVVVTRYFGGILLGTGGLARAYTKGAKDALLAAGVSVERLWDRILVPCSYAQFERVRQETEKRGGVIEDTDYGADVMLTVLTPEGETAGYLAALTELSAGSIEGEKLDQVFRGVPVRLPESS